MRWTWSFAKDRDNKRKHGLSFETAQLVFGDPHALSRPDPFLHEERWQTVGVIGQTTIFNLRCSHVAGSKRGRTHYQCTKGDRT